MKKIIVIEEFETTKQALEMLGYERQRWLAEKDDRTIAYVLKSLEQIAKIENPVIAEREMRRIADETDFDLKNFREFLERFRGN